MIGKIFPKVTITDLLHERCQSLEKLKLDLIANHHKTQLYYYDLNCFLENAHFYGIGMCIAEIINR